MCYFKKVINVSIFAMSCVCSSLPSGFHYGQDSSDKAVSSGEREKGREEVENLLYLRAH